jgi:hypothetical protein
VGQLKEKYLLPVLGLPASCFVEIEGGKREVLHRFLEAKKEREFDGVSVEVS